MTAPERDQRRYTILPPELFDKIKNSGYMIVCIIVFLVAAGVLSTLFLPKDNVIEQVAEDLLEVETGTKIDLTP